MKTSLQAGSWQLWALLSACFASLTAIFGKIGIEYINSDCSAFIRTMVIMAVLALIPTAIGAWQPLSSITPRTWLFLVLSGLATGIQDFLFPNARCGASIGCPGLTEATDRRF